MSRRKSFIAVEGFTYLFIGGALAWLTAIFGWTLLSVLTGMVTIAIAFFFRDPERRIPTEVGSIVSAADGTVLEVEETHEPHFLEEDTQRVSTFLSLFDCHINRFPVEGKVIGTKYFEGRFEAANLKRASFDNERLATLIETPDGLKFVVVQIAGLLARRIVAYNGVGDEINKGDRMGMIKFGSRVDVYMPKEIEITVKAGDKIKGGESIIGWVNDGSEQKK